MAIFRDSPYTSFNFLVDLGMGDSGGADAGFSEVTLPDLRVDVIEYRNGNDKVNAVRKLAGLEHTGNVILRRGVIGSLTLYQWYDAVRNGDANAARTVTIHLQNEDRSQVVMTWKLLRARPVHLSWGTLSAAGSDIAMEFLELACDRVELE
ncbi:MAG: phage tail protein [Gemmatimonadaceae bacterium]|nr:phage tail protein [Gemmatimonadaceae bacterium]